MNEHSAHNLPYPKLQCDWMASDLQDNGQWVHDLTPDQLSDVKKLIETSSTSSSQIQAKHPHIAALLKVAREKLTLGLGVFLIRGFDAAGLDKSNGAHLCTRLAAQLGKLTEQNMTGDLVRAVTDEFHETYSLKMGHRGRAQMLPHTDSADIVGLLCVKPARFGGDTEIASSLAIYRHFVELYPDQLKILRHGFHFDLSGKQPSGLDFTASRIPVFFDNAQEFRCEFNKSRILLGMEKAGLAMTQPEVDAIEQLLVLATSTDFAYRLSLQSGYLLLLNNNYILHARAAFQDWSDINLKRLLYRVWMNNLESPTSLDYGLSSLTRIAL